MIGKEYSDYTCIDNTSENQVHFSLDDVNGQKSFPRDCS